ncbi:MAG: hypothetical protein EXR05_07000 [Acetobacteraceae bacterium]|nr:hypothetical protein [Acetobacteraceae bacterium]
MVHIELAVSRDLRPNGSLADCRRVSRLVIERIITSLDPVPESGNCDYLIGKLAKLEDAIATCPTCR